MKFPYLNNKGVTLVELIVVLAVFMVIITTAVSIFISTVQQQKRILEQQELLNQLSYVSEYMSRSMRTSIKDERGDCLKNGSTQYPGYIYLLTRFDATSGFYKGIKFITDDNVCKEFFFDVDGILKETRDGSIAQNILSSKFVIKYGRFVINGNKALQGVNQTDTFQPRVTALLDVQLTTPGTQQEKIIQITISQRNLNKP